MAKILLCFFSKNWQKQETVKIVPLPAILVDLNFPGAVIFQGQHSIFLPLAYQSVTELHLSAGEQQASIAMLCCF